MKRLRAMDSKKEIDLSRTAVYACSAITKSQFDK